LFSYGQAGPSGWNPYGHQGHSMTSKVMEATMSDLIFLSVIAIAFLALFAYARGLSRL
jgi:hypothetical protein